MSTEITTDHTIEQVYAIFAAEKSDIQAHMPKLRELAAEVKHVTEFGTRTGVSTVSFLAGKPKTLVTWDIDPVAVERALAIKKTKIETDLQPRLGDTTKILIEETDLIFFDTLHTFEQLRAELKRHGNKSRKYLVFHDTAPSAFGYKGEDGSEPGLRAAIRWFQEQTAPRWQLVYDDKDRDNGLIVLQRHEPFWLFHTAEAFQGPKGDDA